MILITGATGRIGRRVVKKLVAAGQSVRVLVRDETRARQLLPDGIDILVGDLADYDLVQSAVEGTRSVMLLSPVDPNQVALQGNVVNAAVATSQPYIVKISGLGTTLDSYVDSGRWHAETEQQIQASGLHHAFLRPLFFMQNLSFLIESARTEGVIRSGVGESKIAMVDADDIADVTAKLLMDNNLLVDQAVSLTTPESTDYLQIASLLTQLLGREVRYEPQSLEEVRHALEKGNQPEWHIDILMQFNRAFLEGQGNCANTVVEDLLDRPATSLVQYFQHELEHADGNVGSNPFPS